MNPRSEIAMKARPVSVHEYELSESVSVSEFREIVREAEKRGLFDLEGLAGYRFLYGMRGAREGKLGALWFWESEDAWEALWGPPSDPKPKEEYPVKWKVWENELLRPLLDDDPDEIRFTSYRTVEG